MNPLQEFGLFNNNPQKRSLSFGLKLKLSDLLYAPVSITTFHLTVSDLSAAC